MWHPQVIASWFDRIVPFEAIATHVVKPRPFRSTHEQNLAFDLIVAQGLHAQRAAGLISVYPAPADPTFPQFAAAFFSQAAYEWSGTHSQACVPASMPGPPLPDLPQMERASTDTGTCTCNGRRRWL